MKKVKKSLFILTAFLFSFMYAFPVYANETADIINRYNFPKVNVATYVLKPIFWGLAKALASLVEELEKAVFSVNEKMGAFFTSTAVVELMDKLTPLAFALLMLVICYIGYTFMVHPGQKNAIVQNLIIAIVVIFGLPILMSKTYTLTNAAITYISISGNQSMADKILSDSVTDVTLYDDGDYPLYLEGNKNRGNISTLDPSEVVHGKGKNRPDVWDKQVVDGSDELFDITVFKIPIVGDEVDMLGGRYYRYNFDWLNIFATLLVSGFALIMAGVKIARLLYELVIHQAMANVLALIDIQSGQRLKKCLQSIVSTFFTLFGCFFLLQIYILGQAYISSFALVPKIICMLALAWAVIDGPNLFEQIVGVDAGLQSGLKAIYGAKAAASIATGGARAVSHMVAGKKGASGHLEGGMRGFIMGNKKPLSSVDEAKDAYQGGVRGILAGNKKSPHDPHSPVPSEPIRNGGIHKPEGISPAPLKEQSGQSESTVKSSTTSQSAAQGSSTQPTAHDSSTQPPEESQSINNSEMQADSSSNNMDTDTDTQSQAQATAQTPEPQLSVLNVPDKHKKEKSLFDQKQSANTVGASTTRSKATVNAATRSPSAPPPQTKTENQGQSLSNTKQVNSKPASNNAPPKNTAQQKNTAQPPRQTNTPANYDTALSNRNTRTAENTVAPLSSSTRSAENNVAPISGSSQSETVSHADISYHENSPSTRSTVPLQSADISGTNLNTPDISAAERSAESVNAQSTRSSPQEFNWKIQRQETPDIPQKQSKFLGRNQIDKGVTKRDIHNTKKNERRK